MNEQQSQQPDQSLNISGSDLNSLQIGGIAGRDLTVNQTQRVYLTNVFGSVQVGPTPTNNTQMLSKQEYVWRRILLSKVKNFWVNGILTKSLHTQVLFKLGLEECNEFVQNPPSKSSNESGQSFPRGTAVGKIFKSLGAGRNLLILGEPGSGKTVILLKLAKSLITRTEQDFSQRLPVIVNLSSWSKKRQPIADWLIQELYEIYQVSKSLGKAWIQQEQLLLLLDGLDEVDDRYQNDCVLALNEFLQEFTLTEMVVCSRIRDYERLSKRLKLRSAIYVQPLTPQQIDRFLERAGQSLSGLKIVLQNNVKLRNFASSPLILSIMSLTYQDCSAEVITLTGKPDERRQQLFDAYIDRMSMRPNTTWQYSREQTLHWLISFAQQMVSASQTVFLIERLQPSCLPSWFQRIGYQIASALIFAFLVGIPSGVFGVVIGALLYRDGWFSDIAIILSGLILLLCGLVGSLVIGISNKIETVETLRWSWQEANKFFRYSLISGGIIIGLDLIFKLTILQSILQVFTILSVILVLIGGFRGAEVQQSNTPNQGIWKSAKNALSLGTIVGLIFSFVFILANGIGSGRIGLGIHGIIWGSICGFWGCFIGGGSACFRHFTLRLMLYLQGYAPWNYARFFDFVANRLFMQKVGGGYIFVHRMLLEHFANMELEPGQR